MDGIETIKMGVEIQANGIIRNKDGRLIARLVDGVEFNSEHVALLEDKEILKEITDELERYFINGAKTTDEKWFKKAIKNFVLSSCVKYHDYKKTN